MPAPASAQGAAMSGPEKGVYWIKDWPDYYEVSDSRKVGGPLTWVAMRTKHDGKGFRRVAARADRSDLLAAWVLIVQVTAKLPKHLRGWLVDAKGIPLTPEDLALKTGWPEAVFERALAFYSDPKQGWIECRSEGITAAGPSKPAGDSPEPSGGFRTLPEPSGHGGYTGQDITGHSPKAPKGADGGGPIGPQDGGGVPASAARTYPPALAASPDFIACWEGEWLPYLLEKKGRMPAIITTDKQLLTCVRLGPAKAIAGIRSAIEKGWSAPDENAKASNLSHFASVRSWELEPDDWKAIWRNTYPPEDFPDAPRYENGTWAEVRADHKKHIHDLADKERRRAS
jgi:hypothetical protein